ncbi:MAG: hypothetical protein FJ304_23690 [Planctomycetes bacterium]|nr:hypothetical protein [Planctomycetota bacterium]
MYPSGRWDGFWVQEQYGRQSMRAFELHFSAGRVTGAGRDTVGPFTVDGAYDATTGAVRLVKQYTGKHAVLYAGHPDGEGSIAGTWTIGEHHRGSFLLRPVLAKPTGDEPIQEIR